MANGLLSKLKRMVRHTTRRLSFRPCGASSICRGVAADPASFRRADVVPEGMHPVFVGKSRRRYLVPSDLVDHPIFQVLIDRSAGGGGGAIIIACEVEMFEHMLWALDNSDPPWDSIDGLDD